MKDIKYSIIMPYYKKSRELRITLDSFISLYSGRDDYEIIVVEDYKNAKDIEENKTLINLICHYESTLNIVHCNPMIDNGYNPAKLFNVGAKFAKGYIIVLTNPECSHTVDILGGLDKEFNNEAGYDHYVVCGCRNVEVLEGWDSSKIEELKWYQHSKYRNKNYHFCSAISLKNYESLGGFDENFSKGIAYDDDDFVDSVVDAGITITQRDDLLVHHINHKNSFELSNYDELVKINRKYYIKKKCTKPGVRIGITIPLTDDKVDSAFLDDWTKMIKPSKFTWLRPQHFAKIDNVRNQLVAQALEQGCTHVIFMDTDQKYPEDTLLKLMSHDKDIVGTVVCRRYPNFNPLLMRGTLGKYRYVSNEDIENVPLLEVDATGTGCIMVKTDVFLNMGDPWFEFGETESGKPVGEDINFCHKARNLGYKIWIDTTIPISHLATMEITYEFYKFWQDLRCLQQQEEDLLRGGD